ncbi:MAG: hypothetical protein H0W73_10105 [Bacteroidetes bacterium]|nr:hypothetical protein [Bacteroidota bacterium]
MPYEAHVYTNNHVLNSALTHICYLVAGSHKFVLRIPNILSFIVLCFGVFKYFEYLNKVSSKIILTTLFLLTFNFLDFFELCRGYGISLGFMLIGLAFLQDYFTKKKLVFLILFSLCWQVALAANLILVVAFPMLLFFIIVFQFRHRLFFNIVNLLLLAFNSKILYSWIKFSFFYKEHGSLDSGIGDDYWQVSFKSLMLLIFGTDLPWFQVLIIVISSIIILITLFKFFKDHLSFDSLFKPQFFYFIMLIGLVLAFYLQKMYLDVNYPEDRTGLFFYLFFVLTFTFFIDSLTDRVTLPSAITLLSASVVYFIFSFNLTYFTHWFYHITPKKIYTQLQDEYKKEQRLFTLGGFSYREMTYAFMNYRADAMLNPMDPAETMHMNCDYAFALKVEKPYYRFFYDEIGYDEKWNRVLLKRKQKIERIEQTQLSVNAKDFKGNAEWFEGVKFNDTSIVTKSCIEADLTINFKNVPKPFNAFLVLQVNDTADRTVYYKKIPLNWIADDLNGKSHHFKITSGPLPQKFGNANVHVWNIDKKDVEFTISDLKIFELKAPGINVVVPKEYYPLIKSITKERTL